jgi:hypothetical protein
MQGTIYSHDLAAQQSTKHRPSQSRLRQQHLKRFIDGVCADCLVVIAQQLLNSTGTLTSSTTLLQF